MSCCGHQRLLHVPIIVSIVSTVLKMVVRLTTDSTVTCSIIDIILIFQKRHSVRQSRLL